MPFPNEHRARQRPPGGFARFRRGAPEGTPAGIEFIWGVRADGTTEVQSIAFNASRWTPTRARAWLRAHDFKSTLEVAIRQRDRIRKERWRVGADRGLPIVEGRWDGAAAKRRVFQWAGFGTDRPNVARAARAFLAYDADKARTRGAYVLPFADVRAGRLVAITGGLNAAAQRLPQTDIPDATKRRAQTVLDSYRARMRKAVTMSGIEQINKRLDQTSELLAGLLPGEDSIDTPERATVQKAEQALTDAQNAESDALLRKEAEAAAAEIVKAGLPAAVKASALKTIGASITKLTTLRDSVAKQPAFPGGTGGSLVAKAFTGIASALTKAATSYSSNKTEKTEGEPAEAERQQAIDDLADHVWPADLMAKTPGKEDDWDVQPGAADSAAVAEAG